MIPSIFANLGKQKNFKYKEAIQLPKPVPSDKKDRATWLIGEEDRWRDYYNTERKREDKNHRMVFPFDQGQWPDEVIKNADKDKASLPQFNITYEKVTAFVGNALRNFIDVSYEPQDGKYTPYKRILEALYLRDKELLDWNRAYKKVVTNGSAYMGAAEMYIDTRYSDLGNIGLRAFEKGQLYVSPEWKTENGWDMDDYMKIAYYTPRQMKTKWHVKDKEIDQRINLMREMNRDNSTQADTEYDILKDHYEVYGQKMKVIEYHYMVPERQSTKQTFDGILIPELEGEDLDRWYQINDISPEQVFTKSSTVNVYYVLTTCPQLGNIVLEDRMHEIQIGRLPLFVWSFSKQEGRPYTLVDILYDAQVLLNKRESLDDRLISTTAFNKVFVDESLFGGDARLIQEYEDNFNNPDYHAIMRGVHKDKIFQFNNDSSHVNLQNEIARMNGYANQLSLITPALSGVSESSKETGVLFHRKQQQSETNIAPVIEGLKSWWNEIGEAYLLLAPQHYDDIYIEFQQGDELIQANIPNIYGGTDLKLSDMPRHRVTVTESPKGVTQRLTDRTIYAELRNRTTDPVMAAYFDGKIVDTLDVDTADRKEMKLDNQKSIDLARKQRDAASLMLDVQIANTMNQLQGGQPQPGAEGQDQQVMDLPSSQSGSGQAPQEGLNNINAV